MEGQKPDFQGYATKTGLKCTDGRTILPGAFQHQDKTTVPLLYMHGHKDPLNVLGHVDLEERPDGTYVKAFFNNTPNAQHMKEAVDHKDITQMSIWANQLIERSKQVMHGVIREVSLVLAGANPGALIEPVVIEHSDGSMEERPDEIIMFGELEHADAGAPVDPPAAPADPPAAPDDLTIKAVYDTYTAEQKDVFHYMVGEALVSSSTDPAAHSGTEDPNNPADPGTPNPEGNPVAHNAFDPTEDNNPQVNIISHADMLSIIDDARKGSTIKDAVEAYALSHGIEDIDTLFPEAMLINNTPEFIQRRTEWVNVVLAGARKSPFSRIKTISADITEDAARAKGYITGAFKKEEFFKVAKRVTTPTTVYKKQKLDRDDVVDITDFDVVVWLKQEMRLMLDEEIARAILLGDGRDISDEDKIDEQCVRPISSDNELFTTTISVNMSDPGSSVQEFIDAVVTYRRYYKGTGLPILFTSETMISKFLLLKDTLGRRIYKNLSEIADELRCSMVVPVEVMDDEPEIVAVFVNPQDYTIGADKGGQVSLFDDFDIDYNQYKYLIETRISGCLVKLKAALVVKKVDGALIIAIPNAPAFDEEAGEVTITNQTGVVYKHGATVINAAGSPYTVTPGTPYTVTATPASGYYFPSSENDTWTFDVEV